MAVRQLTPSERLIKCHVNSVDGSPTYESGIAYEKDTVVQYQGVPYMAIIDIEDTDTDTPDAAPDRWSIVPDANSLAAEGAITNLETRVTALETTVGDDTDGLVKEVDDLQDELNNLIIPISLTVDSATVAGNSSVDVELNNSTYIDVEDKIPSGYKLSAVLFTWATAHSFVPTQCYVSSHNNYRSFILTLYNISSGSVSLSGIDVVLMCKKS